MSGINHLYDLYHNKGEQFINSLFNEFVTINEKMDGSAFSFERDQETGNFKFYRRDQRNPITLVDRTLMKYYEKPISYITSLPPHLIERIPRGWRFGLEYFANTQPVEIVYDRVPKNNLILSYIHQMAPGGKVARTIQKKEKLDEWADLLGVEKSPIIFQGLLQPEQKTALMEFLATPFKELTRKFSTQSFVRFIISVLNPALEKTALNDNLDKDVEGIVFRFGHPDRESETILAKMVDPIFTELAKEKTKQQMERKPSDFLGLTLLDVMNYILQRGVKSFEAEGESEEERYISFMSDVFAKFLSQYSEKYKGTDFDEPDYLKKEEFRLNKQLITDRRVLKWVEEDPAFESLFKLMLNSFRKIKTRASGLVKSGTLEQFNLLVQEIKDFVSKKKINEQDFASFLEFKKITSPPVEYLREELEDREDEENPHFSFDEFISKLETIDQKHEEHLQQQEEKKVEEGQEESPKKKQEAKNINVMLGRFQPFHLGHLRLAQEMKKKNDFPVFVVVVYPGHNRNKNSPFDEEIITQYMDALMEAYPKDFIGYEIVKLGLLGSVINRLVEEGYTPHLVGAGEDREEDYRKQFEYIKKTELQDKLPQDFKLHVSKRSMSATDVREILKAGNFTAVKKLLPPAVLNLYEVLKTALKD